MNNFFARKKGGYVMILNTLLFIGILLVVIIGIGNLAMSHYLSVRSFVSSKQSYLAANSAAGDALYRLKTTKALGGTTDFNFGPAAATVSMTDTAAGKDLNITATAGEYQRKMHISLSLGSGVSFHYGIQSGEGGFVLENTSLVIGNVYSSGSVIGSGNTIRGDVISAGPNGLIDGIHATGTAYAHNIRESSAPTIIDKDAYYTNIDAGVSVVGTKHPGSIDQTSIGLPISDAQINDWEQATVGKEVTCTNGKYVISESDTIGPIHVPCDLEIKGSSSGITVTITGHIWVEGNIDTSLKSLIRIDPGAAEKNFAIIADDRSDPINSGIIRITQNVSFEGSGTEGSYVFMISQNKSSENGGNLDALSMSNGSSALVGYASHGQISLAQSTGVKEITAYKIVLKNSAQVTYDTGLPNLLFQAGPGGGYNLLHWIEN